jgi:hypothetical protein
MNLFRNRVESFLLLKQFKNWKKAEISLRKIIFLQLFLMAVKIFLKLNHFSHTIY